MALDSNLDIANENSRKRRVDKCAVDDQKNPRKWGANLRGKSCLTFGNLALTRKYNKMEKSQSKSSEWSNQWKMFDYKERFLFDEWISPIKIGDLRGKDVLECGCGGGQHTLYMAEFAKSVTAVDLNTIDIALKRTEHVNNIQFHEDDIARMSLGKQFDIVICIGVIHHTDDPSATFENLFLHCKPGGRVIIWTYSAEGNELVRFVVEPIRKYILRWMPRSFVRIISVIITFMLYPVVFTVYRLPVSRSLPYYEYFNNFRRLSVNYNILNVFDKLNAPQTYFTTKAKAMEWFNSERFEPSSIHIVPYVGVSYTLVGKRRLTSSLS